MKNTKKRTDSFKKTYKNNCESLLDDGPIIVAVITLMIVLAFGVIYTYAVMNGYIAPAQISGLNPNINTNISIIITGKSANTTTKT